MNNLSCTIFLWGISMKIEIETYGVGIRSENGGTFYIKTIPKVNKEKFVEVLLNVLSNLYSWIPLFPSHLAWWHVKPCSECKKRFEKRWKFITEKNLWYEAFCKKHALVEALYNNYIEFVDNKERLIELHFDGEKLVKLKCFICSNKHEITLEIMQNRVIAIFNGEKFEYPNTLETYPLQSEYVRIVNWIYGKIDKLFEMMTETEKFDFVIVFNDKLIEG